MMPLVNSPNVFSMRESVYPIMAKVSQNEIGRDSCGKGKIIYASWYQIIGYNDAVEINRYWRNYSPRLLRQNRIASDTADCGSQGARTGRSGRPAETRPGKPRHIFCRRRHTSA